MSVIVTICLYGTSNNTHLVVMDCTQTLTLYSTSGGIHTKAGREKNSVKTANKILTDLNVKLTILKVKYVELRVRNKGACYERYLTSAVKLLQRYLQTHYNVLRVLNVTPVTHGYLTRQKLKRR